MHTYLNIHLSSGLKEKPMLSAFLYCRDNKALHYTVGKVRRNISIGINGEDEPRAQTTGKCISASPPPTKPGSLLPRYILKGHQGLWSAETRQPTVSGKLSSLGTCFQHQRWRRGQQSRAELLHTPHVPAASSTHTGFGAETPHSWARGHQRQMGEAVLPFPSLLPCLQAGLEHEGRAQCPHRATLLTAGTSKSTCGFSTGDPLHSPAGIQHSPGATGPSALNPKILPELTHTTVHVKQIKKNHLEKQLLTDFHSTVQLLLLHLGCSVSQRQAGKHRTQPPRALHKVGPPLWNTADLRPL